MWSRNSRSCESFRMEVARVTIFRKFLCLVFLPYFRTLPTVSHAFICDSRFFALSLLLRSIPLATEVENALTRRRESRSDFFEDGSPPLPIAAGASSPTAWGDEGAVIYSRLFPVIPDIVNRESILFVFREIPAKNTQV